MRPIILLSLSAMVMVVTVLPYLRDVVKRRTKPRIVSWFNWSLLTIIACAASLADHQYASAVLTGSSALMTGLVAILGWHYGDRKFDRLDIFCQLGAFVGLALWAGLESPLAAIITTVIIDYIVYLPTIKHAWQKPYEETMIAWVGGVIAGLLSLAAVTEYTASGLIYPIYIPIANFIIVVLLSVSPHRQPSS